MLSFIAALLPEKNKHSCIFYFFLKEKVELVISVTMTDSAPLIPWQHEDFYSIEPVANQGRQTSGGSEGGGGGGGGEDQVRSSWSASIVVEQKKLLIELILIGKQSDSLL